MVIMTSFKIVIVTEMSDVGRRKSTSDTFTLHIVHLIVF